MKKYQAIWLLTFVIIFFLILSQISITIAHENAHYQIQKYYGCVNGSIEYKIMGNSKTICYEYNSLQDRQTEYFLHSMNEIVGYHAQILIDVLFAVAFIIMLMLILIIMR